MKNFKILTVVCLFFFMIGCEDSPKRLVPIDESGDGSDTTDTTPADTDVPDGDSPDTDAPDTDSPDTDSPDTDAPDTDSPDTDSPDTDSPDTDAPDTDSPDSDAPDSDAPDTDVPDSDAPDTDAPDTDVPEQKYCSAAFDGKSSKIEIANNDFLNLNYEDNTWTIEAWIKQTGDLTTDEIPILAKKESTSSFGGMNSNDDSYVYFLSGYYSKKIGFQTVTAMKGSATYSKSINSTSEISVEATSTTSLPVSNSGDWAHIALVKTNNDKNLPQLNLYINGTKVKSADYSSISTGKVSIVTSTEALLIGSTGKSEGIGIGGFGSQEKFFKGLIDSIRISSKAKYTSDFQNDLKPLKVEDDTVALWDFNGDAKDSGNNRLDGAETNITYSTDCKK